MKYIIRTARRYIDDKSPFVRDIVSYVGKGDLSDNIIGWNHPDTPDPYTSLPNARRTAEKLRQYYQNMMQYKYNTLLKYEVTIIPMDN